MWSLKGLEEQYMWLGDTGLRADQDRVAKSRETPTKTLNNQI